CRPQSTREKQQMTIDTTMVPEPTGGPQAQPPVVEEVLNPSATATTPTTTTTSSTSDIQVEDTNSAQPHAKINGALPDTPMQVDDQEEPRISPPTTKDLLTTIENGANGTPTETATKTATETIETSQD
ncbi:hypothetical protein BGZ52_012688, partial [Haplosporangium bisporale]